MLLRQHELEDQNKAKDERIDNLTRQLEFQKQENKHVSTSQHIQLVIEHTR